MWSYLEIKAERYIYPSNKTTVRKCFKTFQNGWILVEMKDFICAYLDQTSSKDFLLNWTYQKVETTRNDNAGQNFSVDESLDSEETWMPPDKTADITIDYIVTGRVFNNVAY